MFLWIINFAQKNITLDENDNENENDNDNDNDNKNENKQKKIFFNNI